MGLVIIAEKNGFKPVVWRIWLGLDKILELMPSGLKDTMRMGDWLRFEPFA